VVRGVMEFVAKYFSRDGLSKQIATLTKALDSVSTNLSIVAILGLALVPVVADGAASTSRKAEAPQLPLAAQVPPVTAPVEIVRTKPVQLPPMPVPQQEAALRVPPALPDADSDSEGDEPAGFSQSSRVLAQYSRRRRSRQRAEPQVQAESGELGKGVPTEAESGQTGKAGARTASHIPVPDPKAEANKTEATKTEPPEPEEWSAGEIIAALKDCLKRLAPLGAEIEIAAPVKEEQCGNPAPVLLKRIGSGPNRLEFQPPPMLNCAMVASLNTWVEKTLQPAAQETLGTSIARVRGAAGYSCRNRVGGRHSDRLSEHAHANAIDIMGFVTADGRTIDVVSKWGPTARDLREEQEKLAQARAEAQRTAKEAATGAREAARQADKEAADAAKAAAKLPAAKRKDAKAEADRKKELAQQKRKEAEEKEAEVRRLEPVRSAELSKAEYSKLGRGVDIPAPASAANKLSAEATFLRRLHKGACTAFGTVLGPDANEAHRNHFHFDLAPRRRSAYCE
jgi:hypothetical protein